uniref:Uncharacterized protein n=1 Tax=Tanacetum cinerariifolium TaxID=118510 RepID=A0A6L2JCI7_TANCI|nr:hypothetical protein [Tanacetum cinerariifolium]
MKFFKPIILFKARSLLKILLNQTAISNSNEEKEIPPQDSDFHQLIKESSTEVSEKQKKSMEDTMFELVKICQEKELLCIHDNVDDLIESAVNSKLLSINSQRLHIMEQPAECENRSIQSLQNFRVVHKSSISFRNTSQISSIHAIVPILSTKEPEHLLSMRYEHLSITPETESDEVTESNAENLLPIPSKCEVALEDKRECDVPISQNSPVCDNHSDTFSDSNINDDISVYDDDFEDIEYEEEEVDFEDISQIQDIVLREKLLSITRLISNIESLNDNSTPDRVLTSFESDNSLSENFSPEFETFCDHSKETRSGNTTHANYSLLEYDSFCFEIKPDQERLINLMKNDIPDNSSNDPLLEEVDLFLSDNSIPPGIENVVDDPKGDIRFLEELLIDDSILSHESSDSNFEDNPLIPRPPPEPPDAKTNVGEETLVVMNNKDKFDEDNHFFMFVKEFSLLSAESEDTIFDPGQLHQQEYPEIHSPSPKTSDEVFQANHSIQSEESFENSSNQTAVSNSNKEKEIPLQDSDFHQLIEECSTEVSGKQKKSMEDTMLELVKICQEKEFLCIHDNVDDLIESALNSKLLSINSQRLHIMEQPAEYGNRKPEHLLSMGYEHLSITPETESDEVIESNAENLLPIPSKCEVALEDKRECDVPIYENSLVCDNHSDTFSDSNIDDDISVYDDDFKDIEYVEASLPDPEIISVEEENVVQQEEEEIEPNQERLINLMKNDIPDNSSNDPLLEEVDLFLSDNSIPPGIENVADDPEGDIHFLEELLIDDSILSHESSDSNFEDNPLIPRPPLEQPDAETNVGEETLVVMNNKDKFDEDNHFFMFVKEFSLLFAESEDTIFDPGGIPLHQGTLSNLRLDFIRVRAQANVSFSGIRIFATLEEEYHVIKDDTSLVSVYTTRKVIVKGMLIPDNLITDDIQDTQPHKDYEKEFVGVDVLTIQPQPVESHQETTPKATRTTNPDDQNPISTTPPPLSDDRERDKIQEVTQLSLALHKTTKLVEEQENVAVVEKKPLEEDVEKLFEGEDEKLYASEFADFGIKEKVDVVLHDIVPKIASNATNDLIDGEMYVLSLHNIHVVPFLEDDLEEKMNCWVRKDFTTYNEEARLSIQHYKLSWHKKMYKINYRRIRADLEEYFSNYEIVKVVRVTTKQ